MNKTQIPWVKNPDGTQGYTWNPITGCLNHIDGLCKGGGFPCYAYKLANTRLKERYLTNRTIAGIEHIPLDREGMAMLFRRQTDPFYPRFWPEKLEQPMVKAVTRGRTTVINVGKQKGVFVCDMSDLFGIDIPEDWTWKVMQVIEPMLGRFDIPDLDILLGGTLNWVIIGAQTKPYKPPKWEWVSEIIDACVKANIPYFLKNNLEPIVPKVFGGDGNLIQEMPNA